MEKGMKICVSVIDRRHDDHLTIDPFRPPIADPIHELPFGHPAAGMNQLVGNFRTRNDCVSTRHRPDYTTLCHGCDSVVQPRQMSNDETRMTNPDRNRERMTNDDRFDAACPSSFGFRHSFVIPVSSFWFYFPP